MLCLDCFQLGYRAKASHLTLENQLTRADTQFGDLLSVVTLQNSSIVLVLVHCLCTAEGQGSRLATIASCPEDGVRSDIPSA